MSRQTFPDSLIFANSAPEIDAPNATVYGSAYESGAGKTPPKAGVHNQLFNRSDQQHQHVERNGIPQYDPRTPYDLGGLCLATDGAIYQSRTQGNTNNAPASTPNRWRFVVSAQKIEDFDAAIAANTQLSNQNRQSIVNLNADVAANTDSIRVVNERLDQLFIEFMSRLLPVRSAVMRPTDPGLPIAQGGMGFGTWQEKPGRSPIGAGSWSDFRGELRSFGENNDYGNYRHTLTVNEMPRHNHFLPAGGGSDGPREALSVDSAAWENTAMDWRGEGSRTQAYTNSTGGHQPHNNIHPVFGVRIWYRVA